MGSFILTVISPDKPGLVEHLSRVVVTHQGNWLESAFSRLGGQFAGILRVQVPIEQRESFQTSVQALAQQGIRVTLDDEVVASAGADAALPLSLDLVGHDKPGIVRDISQALAARQINVENLTTELVSGSMSAELLFKAQAHLMAPATLDVVELQQALEAIASDLMVDISLEH